MESAGIHDAFVEDDSVSFGFFDGLQGLVVDVPFDLVWVVDLDVSRLIFGFGDSAAILAYPEHLNMTTCCTSGLRRAYLSFRDWRYHKTR